MTPADFDAAFGAARKMAFRLETHQVYTVPGEEAALEAFRKGLPRPVWSVRTDPWLARIAVTTADPENPRHWQRCRIVEHPLTEYTRYEMVGYTESQAAGEEVSITDRAAHPSLDGLRQDFWAIDLGEPGAFVILMRYDDAGHWLDAERTGDTAVLARCTKQRDLALRYAVPLNEYLAPSREQRVKAA